MVVKRKSFQGVGNIVRFNWHFYVITILIFIALFFLKNELNSSLQILVNIGLILAIATLSISLLVSFYIYDVSDLYQLNWLENLNNKKTLNIHAGFDETSGIIEQKFPQTELTIADFYNPKKHTEISIKRARKAYPPNPKTITINTEKLNFEDLYFDESFAILAAHEIRNTAERIQFFKELSRITKDKIYVTEHLRDFPNFLAYTFGFFHFHSKKTWFNTFNEANLLVKKEIKTTPFITTFVLEKNGNTL